MELLLKRAPPPRRDVLLLYSSPKQSCLAFVKKLVESVVSPAVQVGVLVGLVEAGGAPRSISPHACGDTLGKTTLGEAREDLAQVTPAHRGKYMVRMRGGGGGHVTIAHRDGLRK